MQLDLILICQLLPLNKSENIPCLHLISISVVNNKTSKSSPYHWIPVLVPEICSHSVDLSLLSWCAQQQRSSSVCFLRLSVSSARCRSSGGRTLQQVAASSEPQQDRYVWLSHVSRILTKSCTLVIWLLWISFIVKVQHVRISQLEFMLPTNTAGAAYHQSSSWLLQT